MGEMGFGSINGGEGVRNSPPLGRQEVLEQSKSIKTQGHTSVTTGLTVVPRGYRLTCICICHLSWHVYGCFSLVSVHDCGGVEL